MLFLVSNLLKWFQSLRSSACACVSIADGESGNRDRERLAKIVDRPVTYGQTSYGSNGENPLDLRTKKTFRRRRRVWGYLAFSTPSTTHLRGGGDNSELKRIDIAKSH